MLVLLHLNWYHDYPVGGGEIFVRNLINGLDPDVEVILSAKFSRASDWQGKGSRGKVETFNTLHRPLAIKRLIENRRPDIVHTNGIGIEAIVAMVTGKLLGCKVIHTNHSVSYGSSTKNRVLRWLKVRYGNACHANIFPSHAAHDYMAADGTRNGHVISCGVDTKRFYPRDREMARNRLGLADKPTIFYSGRIVSGKGLPILIEACNKIRENLDFQLVIAGPIPDQKSIADQLARQIARLSLGDKVVFMGNVPHFSEELPLLYAAADLFVMPSYYETLNLSTLEAMASARPVVSTNAGGLGELVYDGVNGRVIQSGSTSALADGILELLSNEKLSEAMGAAGRKLAIEHDLNIVMPQYNRIYKELTGYI